VKRHWRGTPVIHPYQMVLSEEWKTPLVTDGVHVQEPILSRALLRSFLLGLLGLALLVALWFALLKPTVRSQAKAVVKPEVAKVDQRLDAAGIPPLPTTIAASKGGGATTTTTTVVGGAGGTGAGGTGGVIDFRLLAGQSRTTPKNKTFSLTDMVFQNPKAAAGVLTISRVTGGSTSVLFSSELANFRDYDLHFVSPFIFPDGSAISVTVACTSDCTDVAVTFAGSER
jgi:hypothetical protein